MKLRRRLATAMGAVALAGCQVSVHDTAQPQKSIRMASLEQDCLAAAVPVFAGYFGARTSEQEVSQSWDCAAAALGIFSEHAKGSSESDSFTAIELRSFLEKNYLADIKISDSFLAELMRIKQVVVGGDADRVTKAELQQTQVVIQFLKSETLRLLPYMKILTLEEDPEEARKNPERVEAAMVEFNRSMANLGQLLSSSKASYEVDHLKNFLQELQGLYTGKRSWNGPDKVINNLSLITALKSMLIRPDGNSVTPGEWQAVMNDIGPLYSLYLRAHYFMQGRDLITGEGLDHLTIALQDGLKLLKSAIDRRPEKRIEFNEIDLAIDELYRLGFVTWPLTPQSLKSLMRLAISRVFNPPVEVEGATKPVLARPEVTGLTLRELDEIRVSVLGWIDMQRVWRELTKRAVELSPGLAHDDGTVDEIPLRLVRKIWPHLSSPYQVSFEDLGRLLNRENPLAYASDGAVIFENDIDRITISQDSFDSLNWKAAVARAVVQGYSNDPKRYALAGLTKREFVEFFTDVTPFAVELKIVSPNDRTFCISRFDEANLFLFSSQNDDRMSFFEGVELLSFGMSSAIVSKRIRTQAIGKCQNYENDEFSIPKVHPHCLRLHVMKNFSDMLKTLPRWQRFTSSLNEIGRLNDWQRLLERAARPHGYSDRLVDSTDISRMSMVLHYVDSIMSRFDTDNSGAISMDEARASFPLFRNLIARKSGYNDDETLMAIFAYILKFGEAPESTADELYFSFFWKNDQSLWSQITVDRMQLLTIIGSLKKAI